MVEPHGRHGLSCKYQMGRRSRHDQINNLLKRALVQAKIPAINEPSNLSRQDGKRPDGLTLTTWKNGKCLIWDTTVADTVCQSYFDPCSKNAGAAANVRETIKSSKYTELANTYCFTPIGIETLGSWGLEGHKLVTEIGKKVMEETGEKTLPFSYSSQSQLLYNEGTPVVYWARYLIQKDSTKYLSSYVVTNLKIQVTNLRC